MDKKLLAALLLFGLCFAEPELTIGLGQTTLYPRENFRFKANTGYCGFSINPYSRMQFGLEYQNTNAILDKRTTYNCYGWLATIKLMLNTVSSKTPYFGFNFGWLNSSMANDTVLYTARGSFTGESVAGYSFKIDNYNRLNIEYRNRYVELKFEDKYYQRSESIMLSWSMVLAQDNFVADNTVRGMNKEEGLINKKEYLQKKIQYNTSQIFKIDKLIDKYNQRILEEGSSERLAQERQFLIDQKKELEKENKESWEILAL